MYSFTHLYLSPFQSPPNFLHAASLAKHVKPVVVIPDEDYPEQPDDEDDEPEPEPLIEVSEVSTSSIQAQPQVRLIIADVFSYTDAHTLVK